MRRQQIRSTRPVTLFTLALCALFTLQPAAAQECVDYQGLEHCAVGGAAISTDGESLTVTVDDPAATDAGVAVSFSEGVVWSSGTKISESADTATEVTGYARSQGQVTSTATVRREDSGALGFSATFTGGTTQRTYSVLVYKGGVFQGGAGGIGNGAQYLFINPNWDEDFIMWLIGQWTFRLSMDDGSCGWQFDLGEARVMQLADGTELVGDEIRLVEEIRDDGHYPYTGFDAIELLGNAPSLTLTSATVLP